MKDEANKVGKVSVGFLKRPWRAWEEEVTGKRMLQKQQYIRRQMGKFPSSPTFLPPHGQWWKNISTQWVSVRFALFFSIRFGVFSESKSTQCRDWRGFPRGKVRSRRRRSIVVRFMCLLILSLASAKSHYNTHCGPFGDGRKEKLTFFCIFHPRPPLQTPRRLGQLWVCFKVGS